MAMTTSNTETVEFRVAGMSCADCVPLITDHLSEQPGVLAATGDFADRTVSVTYRPGQLKPAAIAAAIVVAGYATDWKHEFQPHAVAGTG